MMPIAEALSASLLHFIWQGTAGAVLLGIALSLLRRNTANTRYAVSCLTLAALALAPLLTFWFLLWPGSPAQEVSVASPVVGVGSTRIAPVQKLQTRYTGDLYAWVLPIWAAGVFAFALRLAWAGGYAAKLRRRGTSADSSLQSLVTALGRRLGVRRELRVLTSSIAEVPSVVGWLRPVILLPAAVAVGLTPQQLEALLLHEIAHVRRHDYFVNILQMIVETLLFYHPAVWWVSSRIRYERELCCDDLAVRSCGNAISYARALAQLERLRPAAPGLVLGSANGPLLHRIQRLLGTVRSESGPSRLACAAGLLVGLVCVGLVLNNARAQDQPSRTAFAASTASRGAALQDIEPVPPSPAALPAPPLPPPAPVRPMQALPAAPIAVAPVLAAPLAPAVPAQPLELVRVAPIAVAPAPLARLPLAAPMQALPAAPGTGAPVPPPPPPPPPPPATARRPQTAPPAPATVAPVPPAPPPPPPPPPPGTMGLLQLLGALTTSDSGHWVLFRGNDVISRGGAGDEQQARKARSSLSGDLLWFQLDGKAYVTQDKDVMDQIQKQTGQPDPLVELEASLQRLNRASAQLDVQSANIQRLQAAVSQLDKQLANSNAVPQQSIAELQVRVAELSAASAQLQRAQRDAEMANRQMLEAARSRELGTRSINEILRGAVQAGKAKPAP